MMTMKKIALIAGMGLVSLSVVQAQQDSTMNRTVVVENLYNPTVMDASKVNVLPKVEEPVVPKTIIDYSTSVRPVSTWNYQVMSPMDREWNMDAACRGYLRAGYGNNGNVDARLGYLWDISKIDRLNVAASLDGWNGETTDLNDMDWKSRLYNTRIGLDYKHAFQKMDFRSFSSSRSRGIIITNPPYGERIMDRKETEGLYRDMGKLMERLPGWMMEVICANPDFQRCFGRKADRNRKLYNGNMLSYLYTYRPQRTPKGGNGNE